KATLNGPRTGWPGRVVGPGRRAGGRKGPVDQWRWAAGDRVVAMPRVAEEVSAGGLVIREFGGGPHGVLIARHDRRGRLIWTRPKGHVEAGETVEDAARREVREETAGP